MYSRTGKISRGGSLIHVEDDWQLLKHVHVASIVLGAESCPYVWSRGSRIWDSEPTIFPIREPPIQSFTGYVPGNRPVTRDFALQPDPLNWTLSESRFRHPSGRLRS